MRKCLECRMEIPNAVEVLLHECISCVKCNKKLPEDDVVWADNEGDVKTHTYAYCVGCLPEQENY